MTRKFFGTDGIRGTVGHYPITPDFVLKLAHAVGRVLKRSEAHPTVLIGKDTRISGYMLESALESGFNSAGVDVVLLGPVPTPAVAYLTRAQRASLGVVISASHNPFADNGIKFFSAHGTKLPDDWELAVEAALDERLCGWTPPASAKPVGSTMPQAATSNFARAPSTTTSPSRA
jgi:phosphoglucosamine mutase